MDLSSIRKIYFVGIGGIAMSAAACLAKEKGFEVSGSDSTEVYSPAKDVIDREDINYHIGYSADNVKNCGADLFIFSAGEDETNPEVKYVVEHNLTHCSFPELLYELAKDNLRVVVTGTHGKSTTTAMLGYVLKNIDDSSFLAGAVLKNLQSNYHAGHGHYFVFEGDEYKALYNDPTPKFHLYKPDITVLTNLEFDHPDIFQDLEETKDEIAHLVSNMPPDGLIVYNADNPHLSDIVYRYEVGSVSFGFNEPADFRAENVVISERGTEFDVVREGKETEHYQISLPGEINVYNALAVIAMLRTLGFSHELIAPPLDDYSGLKRRFEIISEKNDIVIVDDYAHHPTAIKATLAAAKAAYPQRRLWAVFEPHTFSRTEALLPELRESFDQADKVILADIYPAREKAQDHNVSTEDIVKGIKNQEAVHHVKNKAEALAILKKEIKPGDIVIVMAVGDFNRLAYDLAESL